MVTSPEGTEIPAGKSAFLNNTFCRAILPFAVNFSYCSFSIYWYFPSKERSVVKIPFNVMSFNGKAFFKLSKLMTPFMPPFNVGSSGLTTSRFMLNGLLATVKVKVLKSALVCATVPPGLVTASFRLIFSTDSGRSGYFRFAFRMLKRRSKAGR